MNPYVMFVWHSGCLLISSIIIHEIAHLAYFYKKIGKPVKAMLNFNSWKDIELVVGEDHHYYMLSKIEREELYWVGILAGFIPLLLGVALIDPIFVVMVVPYLLGCKTDFKAMKK